MIIWVNPVVSTKTRAGMSGTSFAPHLWRASILPHTDDGIPVGRTENERMVDVKHVEIINNLVVEIISYFFL